MDNHINSEVQQENESFNNELIQSSCEENAENTGRKTPFMYIDFRKAKTIYNLLNREVQVNMSDASENSLLHLAILEHSAEHSCMDSIYLLLTAGVDVNRLNNKGHTALDLAVRCNLVNVAVALLWYDAEVNRQDCAKSVLSVAALAENEILFKLLLDFGADVDFQNEDGTSPLHLISWLTNPCIILTVIGKTVDISRRDASNFTLLHHAARKGNKILVQMLLEGGADVSLTVGEYRNTVLHELINENPKDIYNVMKVLLENGADPNARNSSGATPLLTALLQGCNLQTIQLLSDHRADFIIKDSRGDTTLHYAVYNPDPEITKFVLDKGHDANIKGFNGDVALHSILWIHETPEKSIDIIRVLLENGADANARNEFGATPLLYALERCDIKIIKLYSEHGADFTTQDYRGESALHAAARNPRPDVISFLLELGLDIDIGDYDGKTALYAATVFHDIIPGNYLYEVFKVLLINGADTNARSWNIGRTPFLSTLERNDVRIIELFTEWGGDFTSKDDRGESTLHYAARNSYEHVIDLVLNQGLDVNMTSYCGDTPLHIVARNGTHTTCNTLLERGAHVSYKNIDSVSPLGAYVLAHRNSMHRIRSPKQQVAWELIKHTVKLECLNLGIDHDDLLLIKCNPDLKEYYDFCKSEIQTLKSLVVYNDLSIFAILFASKRRLSDYARNENLATTVITVTPSLCTNLNIYYPKMMKKFNKEVCRQKQMKIAQELLVKIMKLNNPSHIVCELIVSYLGEEDLENLINL